MQNSSLNSPFIGTISLSFDLKLPTYRIFSYRMLNLLHSDYTPSLPLKMTYISERLIYVFILS